MPDGADYPFVQIWPARSDRPAWYIAALMMQSRRGVEELRLNGRRSAVGDVALNDSLAMLGIIKTQAIWYFKDEPLVWEGHPWVEGSAWQAGVLGASAYTGGDVGIPTPIEFITEWPYSNAIQVEPPAVESPTYQTVFMKARQLGTSAAIQRILQDSEKDLAAIKASQPVRKIMFVEEEE